MTSKKRETAGLPRKGDHWTDKGDCRTSKKRETAELPRKGDHWTYKGDCRTSKKRETTGLTKKGRLQDLQDRETAGLNTK